MSLLLEIGAAKDEVSSLYSQVGKDKEVIEEDYRKAMEVIFAYDYGCYFFKHNICGDQPKVPNGMPDSSDPFPPKFFMSSKWPSVPAVTKDIAIEAHPSDMAKELKENASTED